MGYWLPLSTRSLLWAPDISTGPSRSKDVMRWGFVALWGI